MRVRTTNIILGDGPNACSSVVAPGASAASVVSVCSGLTNVHFYSSESDTCFEDISISAAFDGGMAYCINRGLSLGLKGTKTTYILFINSTVLHHRCNLISKLEIHIFRKIGAHHYSNTIQLDECQYQ